MASLEDRLIFASLNSYTGKDKASVEDLFLKLAVFPEASTRASCVCPTAPHDGIPLYAHRLPNCSP